MNRRIPRDRLLLGAYILQPYAQTEEHIRELAECGVEMVICMAPKDRSVLDLLEKYHVGCIMTGVFPGWWGGDGDRAGQMSKFNPLSVYQQAAQSFVDHPAIWGVDIGDEPSALDFDHYGQVARTVNLDFVNQLPYLNLYPNYASVAVNTASQTVSQLGTATYAEHIAQYAQKVDLPYISYDFYLYSLNESIGVGKMLDNFRIVADACRATGRDFWYIPQVNGLHETDFTSENMLRYQAYMALCYGATVINWACYTGGWWCNNVLDTSGNKTEQYDKLKHINAELHAFGPLFMQYRNVATHLLGYGGEGWQSQFTDVVSAASLDTGAVRGLTASCGQLAVGQMVHRTDPDRPALLVLNASDPYDRGADKARVSFASFRRHVKVHGCDGVYALTRDGDRYTFDLPANRAALLTFE